MQRSSTNILDLFLLLINGMGVASNISWFSEVYAVNRNGNTHWTITTYCFGWVTGNKHGILSLFFKPWFLFVFSITVSGHILSPHQHILCKSILIMHTLRDWSSWSNFDYLKLLNLERKQTYYVYEYGGNVSVSDPLKRFGCST